MSLGDEIAAVLPQRQALAESLMVDSCVIERATGQTLDEDPDSPTYGEYAVTYVSVWSGKCRVRVRDTSPSTPRAGGQEFTIAQLEVQIPIDGTGAVRPGDRVTPDTASFDASLVGRHFAVQLAPAETHGAMRRLQAQEVTA